VYLERGWNLFSFDVIPEASEVEAVLASIDGRYSFVEGFEGGALSYYPERLYAAESLELNTLRTLDALHGYWIKMDEAGTLSVSGTPVSEDTPLDLEEGWNLVSYLGDNALPVNTALSSIDGLYTAVLGYDGEGQSYYPELPQEMNTLEVLSPERGYWVKMTSAATLVYPIQ